MKGMHCESPLVSIIILNLNGRELIKNCLNSVLRTNYPRFEVIIVDNGSTDNSIELIQDIVRKAPMIVKFIENQRNLGFAEGNEVGVRNSNGKYVAFLNNDTLVDQNWLHEIIALLEKEQNIAAVQSLLLARDGSKIDSLGGTIDILGTAEESVILGNSVAARIGDGIAEIFSACAASMVVRKSVLNEVGPFDSKFFAYFEDVDLCWRIRLRGYKIVVDLDSIVYHVRGATSKRFGKRLFDFHLYKNQIAMLIKNYELKNLFKVMPGVSLLYLCRLGNGLIKNDAYLTMATLKAILWNIKEFPYLSMQRRYIQTCVRRVGDDQITKMMTKTPLHLIFRTWK